MVKISVLDTYQGLVRFLLLLQLLLAVVVVLLLVLFLLLLLFASRSSSFLSSLTLCLSLPADLRFLYPILSCFFFLSFILLHPLCVSSIVITKINYK